jgi:NADPH-dependent curcumin reductase CurA
MPSVNRQITLASRPSGFPRESDFNVVTAPVPRPADGEILVRTIYLSLDPYMRGRMNDRQSYAPSVRLGEVMVGGVVGKVVASKHVDFPEGSIIEGPLGWQEYAISTGRGLRLVDPKMAPIATAIGVLGMPGMTAYFGLLDICHPKAGETVLVSGAAGAVGSLVGQIAKIKGCTVVGTAGSDEKLDHVVGDLGFDAAFNYKTADDYVGKLREVCPKGIDIYFDNVGGRLTDAVFLTMNVGARISVCGQISQYNLERPEMGPRLFWKLIEKRAKVQGFLVFDFAPRFPDALRDLSAWLHQRKIQYRETIIEGIENAPRAFIGMLQGHNTGKQLVKVSDE